MLKVEGLNGNEIKLKRCDLFNQEFKVISTNGAYKRVPFFIYYISNKNIIANVMYGNTLTIQMNPSMILYNEYISLKNTNGDSIKLLIIPNDYYTMEKTYEFVLTYKRVLKNGGLSLKVSSTANDNMDIGWKCTYNGKPMSYTITPLESENGGKILIIPNGDIVSEFDSLIEFTQDESNKKIKLLLTNTPNK